MKKILSLLLATLGGPVAIGAMLRITPSAVSQWSSKSELPPARLHSLLLIYYLKKEHPEIHDAAMLWVEKIIEEGEAEQPFSPVPANDHPAPIQRYCTECDCDRYIDQQLAVPRCPVCGTVTSELPF